MGTVKQHWKQKPINPTPIIYIGIDPGMSGGIAVLCGASVAAITMPRTDHGIWDYLSQFITVEPRHVCAGMEQVGGYIKDNPTPGSAMFNFGENCGHLRMACVAGGLKVTKGGVAPAHLYTIPPQEWQRGLKIDPHRTGESDTDWKNRLRWNAEELFPKRLHPSLRVTLRNADALLIAAYVRQQHQNGA